MGRRRNAQAAPKPARKPLFLGYDAAALNTQATRATVREAFGPARTLGCSEEMRLAQDTALEEAGVYSLIAHTMDMGMWGGCTQFLGYAALQQIAQHGLLRACIETVADDMTREWIDVIAQDGGAVRNPGPFEPAEAAAAGRPAANAGFTKAGSANAGARDAGPASREPAVRNRDRFCRALEAHGMQDLFHRACELVGYEEGCFIFLDTGVSGPALADPLDKSGLGAELTPGGTLRFVLIDPVNCAPGGYNCRNPLAPDYFVPEWWMVQGTRVHASRLIRMVANEPLLLMRPAYNFLGIPQAQLLWDYVLHFQQNRNSANRLLNKFSLTAFKTNMEATLQEAAGVEQLDARMQMLARFRNNDGVLALDKDSEELVQINTPLSGVRDLVQQSLEHLAALNRTPAVKLLGISPSGFNATGESDIRNYYDHIRSQQEKVIRPALEEVFRVLSVHLFGTVDAGMSFEFAAMSRSDEADAAAAQQQRAAALASLVKAQVISPDEARKYLRDSPDSGFDFLEPVKAPGAGARAGQEEDGSAGQEEDGSTGKKAGPEDRKAQDGGSAGAKPAEPFQSQAQ